MEDLFREANDARRGLWVLEVRLQARKARDTAIPGNVLHLKVPGVGMFRAAACVVAAIYLSYHNLNPIIFPYGRRTLCRLLSTNKRRPTPPRIMDALSAFTAKRDPIPSILFSIMGFWILWLYLCIYHVCVM